MRDFCPVIAESEQINDERLSFLNSAISKNFEYFIQQQSGLVAEIAHLTIDESGRPLTDWLNSQSGFLEEINFDENHKLQDKTLVESILGMLSISTESEAEANGLQVAVERQVNRYLALEVAILASINTHIQSMQVSLGERSGQSLVSVSDLSAMCGGITLREWPNLQITASNV